MAGRVRIDSSPSGRIPFSYVLLAAGGGAAGCFTAIASGFPLKWFIPYLAAVLLVVAFALSRAHKRLALGLFMFFLPFFVAKKIYSSGYSMITGGPSALGVFLYDIPLAILVAGAIAERVLRSGPALYIPRVLWPLLLFIAWSGISILNAAEPALAVIECIWLCKMALILVLVANTVRDRKDIIFAVSILAAGLLIQEVITFSQAYLKVWFTAAGDIEHTTLHSSDAPDLFRAGGTLGPHNVQAAYYVLLIPLAAGSYLAVEGRLRKSALLCAVFGGMYALLLTYSRNGYLSLAVAMTVLALLAYRRNMLTHRLPVAATLLLVIVSISAVPAWRERIISRISSQAAIEPRMESMQIAVKMIRSHPLIGVGLNNFALVMGDREYSPEGISTQQQTYFGGEFFGTVVHNKYLLVASQTGIIGLGMFLWIVYAAYAAAFSLVRDQARFYGGIGIGMTAALTGASVQMMFDIYNSDLLITVFWVLMGILAAAQRSMLDEGRRHTRVAVSEPAF